MYRDFGTIFVFIFIGIVLIYLPLLIQKLLAPNNPNPDKLATYECGEESEGSAWVHEGARWVDPQTVVYRAGLTTLNDFEYVLGGAAPE